MLIILPSSILTLELSHVFGVGVASRSFKSGVHQPFCEDAGEQAALGHQLPQSFFIESFKWFYKC